MDIEPRRIDHDISQLSYRRHQTALARQDFTYGPVVTQRMRTARFAEPPQQRLIGGFDEHQTRGHLPANLLIQSRQTLNLIALAGVHQERGALHFGIAIKIEFAERGDQVHRQVIHAVITEVFEGLQNGAFSGAAQPRQNHQLAAVRRGAMFHVD